MSDPDGDSRPKRHRTVLPTYNLKILNDKAHHTRLHPSNRQKRDSTGQPHQRSKVTHMEIINDAVIQPFFDQVPSSPLTPLTGSPRTPPVTGIPAREFEEPPAGRHTVSRLFFAKNDGMEYECFNRLASARGHYYSAPALHARGVWVGYLARDKHKKQYLGIPSFNDLKTNFTDMTLPFPPTNEATSAINRNAVCRGCFGQQSALLTLREVHFLHNRKVVILPLDGDDEMGMFCILLPQPMDRSMKTFQKWRPYEVRNGGDGKQFDNNFVLFSLRDTLQDSGTLEAMRAALDPQDVTPVVVQTTSPAATASKSQSRPGKRVTRDSNHVPSLGEASIKRRQLSNVLKDFAAVQSSPPRFDPRLDDPPALPPAGPVATVSSSGPKSRGQTIRGRSDSSGSVPRQTPPEVQWPLPASVHRAMTKSMEPQSPPTERSQVPTESSTDLPPRTAPAEEHPILQSNEQRVLPGLAEQQAQDIFIVWKLNIDADACELPVTLAECSSFSGLLQTLRDVAQSLPLAAAVLEKSILWRLTYPQVGGKRKMQLARKGTEVAFDRMQADLVQLSSLDQGMIEVELEAVG